MRDAAPDARHPVRRRRPDRRAAPRHAVDRRDELERRPDGDPPPARPRAIGGSGSSADRRGSCAAGPASTATARRWTRPACRSTRTLISHGEFHVERGHREGPRAPAAARPPDGDLRRQRPPGARRLPGRARGAAAHPGGPERRRLRRPAGRPLGRPAADDDPPAARPDGRGRGRAGPARWRDGEQPAQTRVELATELIIRESTAPPKGGHRRERARARSAAAAKG